MILSCTDKASLRASDETRTDQNPSGAAKIARGSPRLRFEAKDQTSKIEILDKSQKCACTDDESLNDWIVKSICIQQ
jgi:hypothetical protein